MKNGRAPYQGLITLGQPYSEGWRSRFALRTRTWVKRVLIAGYCWHVIPQWAVSVCFRSLRLGAL